ncbi:MAG: NAD(P)/FAD-dependent oxidoreductase [Acholeplasmataceae bacterium]
MYDVLVIGAGPAGVTASIYTKRANLKVAVFEGNVPGGQLVNYSEIENYPGVKSFSSIDLATDMIEHMSKLDIEVKYENVTKLEDHGSYKTVSTDFGLYDTKAVIIATGNVPRKLGVENEEQLAYNGISWCAICDGPIYRDKDVIVVGGGNSAVEEGYYLSTFTKSVTVVQNLDRLTAEAKANEKLIQQPNVKVYYETLVDKFLKDDKGLTGATLKDKDGNTFDVFADGVFEYVGMIPVTDFVKHLGITTNYGYIKVNEKMETKIPGILSCGDVNDKQIRQVVTAVGDGAVAAQNALKYLESLH